MNTDDKQVMGLLQKISEQLRLISSSLEVLIKEARKTSKEGKH